VITPLFKRVAGGKRSSWGSRGRRFVHLLVLLPPSSSHHKRAYVTCNYFRALDEAEPMVLGARSFSSSPLALLSISSCMLMM